tara:strand:+ start:1203 stop:1511 length:309 start_codon:yes stop_codon:yes gene_type:complete
MQITENAINQVAGMKSPKEHLRVYISGGGCSGFNYGFKLDENTIEGDFSIEKNGVKVLVDPMSYQYLEGILIDYVQDLMGARFQVSNPNAKTTCGCGSSFSV